MELAAVDVELFVQDGVPRDAFVFVPSPGRGASWTMTDDVLRALGWTVELGSCTPPADHVVDIHAPHPYALGPRWDGANSWRAVFALVARGQRACRSRAMRAGMDRLRRR